MQDLLCSDFFFFFINFLLMLSDFGRPVEGSEFSSG